jgi:hypothetical protein
MDNRFVACTGTNSDWVVYRSCRPITTLRVHQEALKLTLFGDAPRAEPINPEACALYLQAVHISNHA